MMGRWDDSQATPTGELESYRHTCYHHRHLPPLPLRTLTHVRWPVQHNNATSSCTRPLADGFEKQVSPRCAEQHGGLNGSGLINTHRYSGFTKTGLTPFLPPRSP
ncbi:hypothetical protein MRX96_001390 [Rhipicephalus microplus]